VSASRPARAAQVWSATTAIPDPNRRTCRTPGTFLASLSSNLLTLPPKGCGRAMTAKRMPGTRTSMP